MENSFFYANNFLKPIQVCVPLTGDTITDTIIDAQAVSAANPDLIEWRADGVWDFMKDMKPCADAVATFTKEIPLLFTWRSHRDGGRLISDKDYINLIDWAIKSEIFTMVDIELSLGDDDCKTLIEKANENGIETILSYHNFSSTPSQCKIIEIFDRMFSLNPTAAKIAIMPQSKQDVINLVSANLQFRSEHSNYPTIAIAMGELGKITRLAGAFCESAFTFAAVTKASAPGQVDIKTARKAISLLNLK